MGCTVVGCGKALPQLEIENDDLQAIVETNHEWIVTRTGICSRHIAVDESAEDLAEAAARRALGWDDGGWADGAIEADSIDLLIYATFTPDTLVPSASCSLKRRLGLGNAIAFDLNAACTGFIYGMTVAECMMAASDASAAGAAGRNPIRRALIVGAERLSRVTNWAERGTCVLFGDGAGAAVLEFDASQPGMLASFIANADDPTEALTCPALYDAPVPFTTQGIDANLLSNIATTSEEAVQVLGMDGQKVFKFATEAMTTAIRTVVERAGLTLDDIDCIVPHQANERIIKYAAKKIGKPLDLFQLSIANTGNTSAASVPMALSDAYTSGRIKPGDKVVLVGFGGGFTSGAVIYQA